MPKNGKKAISGILDRIKDRPDNNISKGENCDWDDNWDNGWENDSDIDWENNTWD